MPPRGTHVGPVGVAMPGAGSDGMVHGPTMGMLPETILIDTNALLHDSAFEHYEREYKKTLQQTKLERRSTASIKSTRQRGTDSGDEIIDKIRYLLQTGFGIKRSEIQVKIHKAFLEACLPKIYQGVWDKNKPRILREFRLAKLMQEVLVVMPRRRGKTYATAMMAAAIILTVPDSSVAVFSTGMFFLFFFFFYLILTVFTCRRTYGK